MPLAAGTRIGPYEILAAIGAGRMGEVYRARDMKLGRELALKVLPVEVSTDTGRLTRFEQEARSASALNHPNIVTIYEIGRVDATSYIAMELVAAGCSAIFSSKDRFRSVAYLRSRPRWPTASHARMKRESCTVI